MLSVLLISSKLVYGQDSVQTQKALEIRGYVKNMQAITFTKNFEDNVSSNLLHNRINVRWNPVGKLSGAAEFRNRLIWGEEVRTIPGYADLLENQNEAFDMAYRWISKSNLILHTNVERLWLEYRTEKWNTRIGRQRINWGMTTIWNPNDIFNTYNFLDFDYEERPGSDAIKFSYLLGDMSNVEVAAAAASESKNTVAAIKYFTNKWNYDFQFSGGVYQEIVTLGTGWSGSINNTGFKGELQYFFANDSAGQFNMTLEADYIFEKSWYLNVGMLFNSYGITRPVETLDLTTFQLSPQNLMPTKWNAAVTVTKEFTPLLSGNLSVIYAPGTNLMILLPGLKYNLATNIDFDLIWQSFFAEQQNTFESVMHRGFLRVKWNF
ncbi:hypothetical protein [Chryseolinea sp. H1M3-3]|uniref:hypothetical protein n=1 Tax=Chryseolinea sp. H1M3-3 TaxID=3034144 RepID=UPI0023EB30B0|nr:hypothetical protein [Chryseolinea sp. H1M3-3]